NRAVAVCIAQGPTAALTIVDELETAAELADSHLLASVRGELLAKLRRRDEARAAFARAIDLCRNDRERALLEGKLAELG
ncbi:tetratricopeptide repeat protein, partial [Nocardia tengchongensis]|uniref:tetratricopeptide repeat protein n=1 Tax=Nocardia tengchongensis TaxID=2055889 RepID=UPI00367D84A1